MPQDLQSNFQIGAREIFSHHQETSLDSFADCVLIIVPCNWDMAHAGPMRGGETGGVKERAQDAIAAIRDARELLGEGPRFKDVDSTAINAGDAHQERAMPSAPEKTSCVVHLRVTYSGAFWHLSEALGGSKQGTACNPAPIIVCS